MNRRVVGEDCALSIKDSDTLQIDINPRMKVYCTVSRRREGHLHDQPFALAAGFTPQEPSSTPQVGDFSADPELGPRHPADVTSSSAPTPRLPFSSNPYCRQHHNVQALTNPQGSHRCALRAPGLRACTQEHSLRVSENC